MNLFSTYVHPFQVEGHNELCDFVLNWVNENEIYSKGRYSMRGGHHSIDTLALESKGIASICYETTKAYFAEQNQGIPLPNSVIIKCWAMVMPNGAYSTVHTHPGAKASGVLWLKVPPKMPEDEGNFVMIDPRVQMRSSGQELMTFAPQEGHGFVFPSWLEHYVDAHYQIGKRVSISWNVIW